MGERQDSVELLALHRPGGSWVLRQSPDGKIETMTVRCRSDIPAGTTPIVVDPFDGFVVEAGPNCWPIESTTSL